jgi:hypothetical protein
LTDPKICREGVLNPIGLEGRRLLASVALLLKVWRPREDLVESIGDGPAPAAALDTDRG